jgi:phosphoglycerate dehydrogenase-like enzyme
MGIIGFGTVGRAVAKRAQAFDLKIVAVDLYPHDKPEYVKWLADLAKLSDLLHSSDYVVVTVPWTPQTEGMIGQKQLEMMKPGAIIVGISRGGVIDQDALAQSLKQGHLRAAALDVFRPEPLPEDSELWDLDDLLITPHAAGGTQFEGLYVLEILRENLRRFLAGDLPLRNQIDKQRGF